MPLLAVTLPDALTVVAATAPTKLPPWILPVVLMLPDPNVPPVADMLPVTLKLVPVAAPMLGVVKLALALTMMLPPASNAVVVLSTLVLNTVPTKVRPAAVLAV